MKTFSDYKITSELSHAEKQSVYRAVSLQNRKPVILKVLNAEMPDQEDIAHLKYEYNLIKNLNLSEVVHAYSLEQQGYQYALVMEDLADGYTLNEMLTKQKFTIEKFLKLAIQLAQALHGLHSQHVIHKDVNPKNILVSKDGESIKLIDFSLATQLAQEYLEYQSASSIEGTLAYISPEQTSRMNRVIDERSDLYSLGVVFYEMLTGDLPFKTLDAMELIHSHIAKKPLAPHIIRPEIPEILSQIVMKLLSKSAEDRYSSAYGLKADLEKCRLFYQRAGQINPFTLAEKDSKSIFHIPQKLYGREKEVESLLSAFNKISEGASGLVLVSGHAGIGKSSLINEVHKPITERKGYFISGKYDQYQTQPYHAIIQAFRKLIQQMLGQSKEEIEFWRKQVKPILGENGQIIVDVIPEVEKLIGKQPPVNALNPLESRNRFELTFLDFIKACVGPKRPLVIFLDDLQWGDLASFTLMNKMLSDPELKYFLLIGAYRDKEVGSDHPFMHFQSQLNKAEILFEHLKLQPLSLQNVKKLISDTVNTNNNIDAFSEIIYDKTAGNPFFVKAFLTSLYKEKQINYDGKDNIWMWNLEKLKTFAVTENVVDLLIDKIKQLPIETQEVLKTAATIGNQFDLDTLALVHERSTSEIANLLWIATQENLIIPLSDNVKLVMADKSYKQKIYYKTAHDKIQQALYSLVTPEELPKLHLKIAKILLAHTSDNELKSTIFEIATHFNMGLDLITDPSERIKIANLNLQAGQKAKQSIAYTSAVQFYEGGIKLLNTDSWRDNYNLSFELHLGYAEGQHLLGRYKEAEDLFSILIKHANNTPDKIKVILNQLSLYQMQFEYKKTLEVGLVGLNILGLKAKHYPSKLKVAFEFFKIINKMRKKTVDEIYNLPEMQDTEKKLIPEIIGHIDAALYLEDPNLSAYLAMKALDDNLTYGNNVFSSSSFSNYAVMTIVAFKKYKLAAEYGRMIINLAEKFKHPRAIARSYLNCGILILPWSVPLKELSDFMSKSYYLHRQIGEFTHANFCTILSPLLMFARGENLQDIYKELQSHADFIRFCNYTENIVTLNMLENCFPVLFGSKQLSNFQKCVQSYLNNEFVYKHEMADNLRGIILLSNAVILGEWQLARQIYDRVILRMPHVSMQAFYLSSEFYFFGGLLLLNIYMNASPNEKTKYLRQLKLFLKKFKLWTETCPENFRARYLILLSGFAGFVEKNLKQAYLYCEQATDYAKEQQQFHLVGLANECLARIYVEDQQNKNAKSYLQEAIYSYRKWGALGKIELLTQEFPEWLTTVESEQATSYAPLPLKKTIKSSVNVLDLGSVMKSSQVISSQVKLNLLLKTLIQIVLENAGAERCVVLLLRNNKLYVEGEGSDSYIKILQHKSIEKYGELSPTIVRYVQNSLEPLVVDDARNPGSFSDDYIAKNRPLSILSFPILYQGRLIGVLYLENNLTTGAFTPERLEVLKLLASQMAISIENAMLYKAYDQFVPHEFLDLLGKRSIVDIRRGDQVKKFMTIMFVDIRNFTQMSEKMTPAEVFVFINKYLEQMEPIIKKYGGFIDKFIGDAIMALFPSGANDAVQTAVEMLKKLEETNISIGVGINSGNLMLGTLGGRHRLETSVLSDAVNVAARIEDMTKDFGCQVLIGEDSYDQLSEELRNETRFIGEVQIRGKEEKIGIWEMYAGDPENVRLIKNKISSIYHRAINLFNNGDYKEAAALFRQCLDELPEDKVVKWYLSNCDKSQILI